MNRLLSNLLVAGLILAGLAFSASAPGAMAQAPTGWMNTPGVSPDEVNEVARSIWCPLCSGVRLDSCELKACDQMKDVIALKLVEGADSVEIREYFLEQYGPQILGEPPREGFNWLAWILPFAVVGGGGVFLWRQARRLVRSPVPEAGTESVAGGPQSSTGAPDSAVPNKEPQEGLERRLDEELAKYG